MTRQCGYQTRFGGRCRPLLVGGSARCAARVRRGDLAIEIEAEEKRRLSLQ